MIGTIAARELRSLFLSPLAWVILAVVQAIMGFLFLGQVDTYLQVQPQLALMEAPPGLTEVVVGPLLASATIVMLVVIPLLTMRLLAEERRARTLPLLLSAPVSMSEIVLGKYLGVLGFLLVMVLLTASMPLALLPFGRLDPGMFAAGVLGLLLLVSAFAAAGLFMSTLTAQPAVAAVGSFGLLLLLWIIDWAGNSTGADGSPGLLGYLSLQAHYSDLIKGIFDSSDVVYYLLFTLTFLGLSIRRLDAERLPH